MDRRLILHHFFCSLSIGYPASIIFIPSKFITTTALTISPSYTEIGETSHSFYPHHHGFKVDILVEEQSFPSLTTSSTCILMMRLGYWSRNAWRLLLTIVYLCGRSIGRLGLGVGVDQRCLKWRYVADTKGHEGAVYDVLGGVDVGQLGSCAMQEIGCSKLYT